MMDKKLFICVLKAAALTVSNLVPLVLSLISTEGFAMAVGVYSVLSLVRGLFWRRASTSPAGAFLDHGVPRLDLHVLFQGGGEWSLGSGHVARLARTLRSTRSRLRTCFGFL